MATPADRRYSNDRRELELATAEVAVAHKIIGALIQRAGGEAVLSGLDLLSAVELHSEQLPGGDIKLSVLPSSSGGQADG